MVSRGLSRRSVQTRAVYETATRWKIQDRRTEKTILRNQDRVNGEVKSFVPGRIRIEIDNKIVTFDSQRAGVKIAQEDHDTVMISWEDIFRAAHGQYNLFNYL